MKIRFLLLLVVLSFGSFSQSSEWVTPFTGNSAFTYGEKLTYKMRYSLYVNIPVVELSMEVTDHPVALSKKNHYHLVASAESYKFFDAFFKVRDEFISYVDIENFTPTYSINKYHEGNYSSKKTYTMNQSKGTVKNQNGNIKSIPYLTQDILSCFYLARTFDLSKAAPGDSFMLNLFVDDSLYHVGFIFERREKVKIHRETYNCLRLRPILIVDRVFKSEEEMTLWVSDDKNKIPVKIYTGISVGAVSAVLDSYKGLKYKLNKSD